MKLIVLVLMITNYLTNFETYICYGSEESYYCENFTYSGYASLHYPKEYLSDVVHLYESDHFYFGASSDFQNYERKSEPVRDWIIHPLELELIKFEFP